MKIKDYGFYIYPKNKKYPFELCIKIGLNEEERQQTLKWEDDDLMLVDTLDSLMKFLLKKLELGE